jgi:hypothetical protein
MTNVGFFNISIISFGILLHEKMKFDILIIMAISLVSAGLHDMYGKI